MKNSQNQPVYRKKADVAPEQANPKPSPAYRKDDKSAKNDISKQSAYRS